MRNLPHDQAAPSEALEKAQSAYFRTLALALTGSVYPQSSDYLIQPCRRPGIKNKVKSIVATALLARGFKLYKSRPFDEAKRVEGEDWPSIGYSMVGLRRMENLVELTRDVVNSGVPGDLVECGVWRGGASMMMKAVLDLYGSSKTIWLADSFKGLPAPSKEQDSGHDLSGLPYLAVTEEAVRENFARFDLLDDNVRTLKGWFSETLPNSPIDNIAILRADADLYESTMDILQNLYAKVSPRGYVIIDDYLTWEPCRKAVDEFRATHGIAAEMISIDASAVYWRVPN